LFDARKDPMTADPTKIVICGRMTTVSVAATVVSEPQPPLNQPLRDVASKAQPPAEQEFKGNRSCTRVLAGALLSLMLLALFP
jgi:hypothetical protein